MSRALAVLMGVRLRLYQTFITHHDHASRQLVRGSQLALAGRLDSSPGEPASCLSSRHIRGVAVSHSISLLVWDVPALPNLKLFYNPPLTPMTECGW